MGCNVSLMQEPTDATQREQEHDGWEPAVLLPSLLGGARIVWRWVAMQGAEIIIIIIIIITIITIIIIIIIYSFSCLFYLLIFILFIFFIILIIFV